jgi:hypothetical protein
MPGHFELKKDAKGKYMFNLKAANNEVVLTGESYSSKTAAQDGIASVIKNAASDKNFERKKSSDDKPYFTLKSADNGQTLGRSEMYSSAAAMEKGVKAVMSAAKGAKTKEV